MYFFILALLLIGCGDTVENYYAAAPIESTDAATTPDASPDAAADTFAPDTSQPDTYAPPDVAVDTWVATDTWVAPDTYVAPVDSGHDAVDAPSATMCQGGRFELLEGVTADCKSHDGSGVVLDHQTGLTWRRTTFPVKPFDDAKKYCESIGDRLPTLSEVLGIAGANFSLCAFPCNWETWASDWVSPTRNWVAASSGDMFTTYNTSVRRFLCVND